MGCLFISQVKLTCDAFCNLRYHLYQCIHLLLSLQERVQILLSLSQNNVSISRNSFRLGVLLVCGKYNSVIIN